MERVIGKTCLLELAEAAVGGQGRQTTGSVERQKEDEGEGDESKETAYLWRRLDDVGDRRSVSYCERRN